MCTLKISIAETKKNIIIRILQQSAALTRLLHESAEEEMLRAISYPQAFSHVILLRGSDESGDLLPLRINKHAYYKIFRGKPINTTTVITFISKELDKIDKIKHCRFNAKSVDGITIVEWKEA